MTALEVIQRKFTTVRGVLRDALIERDEEIDLALTALVAQEHVLFVGPPGTAKSMLADAVTSWLDGEEFSICLTKFTTPEEVFGPVSLAGLKNDEFRRVVTGKLPKADIAFMDEIFKASSAILNTLLTVLNERRFRNNGGFMACPLKLCIAASNEWPGGTGGKELGALFDRFMFRKLVSPISSPRGIDQLLWTPDHTPQIAEKITPAELCDASEAARVLPWAKDAKEAYLQILHTCRKEGISPGDRRKYKAVAASRSAAWLAGSAEVTTDHLDVMSHLLWDDPAEQPAMVAKIVAKVANPLGAKVNGLQLEAAEIIAGIDPRELSEVGVGAKKLEEILGKLDKCDSDQARSHMVHITAEIRRIKMACVEVNIGGSM